MTIVPTHENISGNWFGVSRDSEHVDRFPDTVVTIKVQVQSPSTKSNSKGLGVTQFCCATHHHPPDDKSGTLSSIDPTSYLTGFLVSN